MAVKVKIPTVLRKHTAGTSVVEVEAGALSQCITSLDEKYPGIKDRLCDEQGGLRRFVNFYVNGEDIRFLSGATTELKDGEELSIVPAVAGGC